MLELLSRSVNFVLAFSQADIDADVYMKLPARFKQYEGKKYILKLNKNLYGLCQGSHNWYLKLR